MADLRDVAAIASVCVAIGIWLGVLACRIGHAIADAKEIRP